MSQGPYPPPPQQQPPPPPYPPAAAPPSWAVPILFGAGVTFVMSGLLSVLGSTQHTGVQMATCCCCASAFLPYGFVPAFVAQRRDPRLTAGQGFAVSFIAVGIGMVLWAGVALLSGAHSGAGAAEFREVFTKMQEQTPEDRRLTEEELDQLVENMVAVWPYIPVIVATVITVLAGFVGMVATSVFRPRYRYPPMHTGDPSG